MKDKRKTLVDKLFNQGYIKSQKVKNAMLKVPREQFMPQGTVYQAYADRPFPIGKGQTISAPHMVAIIAERLDLEGGMNILEIGTGWGYNAAVVAEVVAGKATSTPWKGSRNWQQRPGRTWKKNGLFRSSDGHRRGWNPWIP